VKAITYTLLLLAMAGFGFGVYQVAGALKTDGGHVVSPSATTAPALPGTMYVAQRGALYRFKDGSFTQITDAAGWTQPSASPEGSELVAVIRHLNYSDVYLLSSNGRVLQQLTHHESATVEANHWSFYPRFNADRSRVFYSYDEHDAFASYRVDLAVYARAADGSGSVVQWTVPNGYTGGDTDPAPLGDGGLIYTKYSIDDRSQVHSQVWFVAGPGQTGAALTPADENCSQPAVAPNQKTVAMICRHGELQSTDLVVAQFDETTQTLGPESVLVHGQLSTAPVFSPDGQTIAFLAPVQPGEAFQLWTVPAAASTSRSAARPMTENLALDSSAPPAWVK
jgi:Tol biopolymer transport system component